MRSSKIIFNVSVETPGTVPLGCHPGPQCPKKSHIMEYVVNMADMGFGLTKENVMQSAYKIVEKTGKQHPFRNGSAEWSWFKAFHARHPKLTFRMPQSLSYCRALCSNERLLVISFQSWELHVFTENLTSLSSLNKS